MNYNKDPEAIDGISSDPWMKTSIQSEKFRPRDSCGNPGPPAALDRMGEAAVHGIVINLHPFQVGFWRNGSNGPGQKNDVIPPQNRSRGATIWTLVCKSGMRDYIQRGCYYSDSFVSMENSTQPDEFEPGICCKKICLDSWDPCDPFCCKSFQNCIVLCSSTCVAIVQAPLFFLCCARYGLVETVN